MRPFRQNAVVTMPAVERVPVGPEVDFPLGGLIVAATERDGQTVAELVPPGFDRYLRIFHPFLPADPDDPEAMLPGPPRTWASLADEAGVVFHPEITWWSLLPVLGGADGPRPYWVSEGDIDEPARSALFKLLAEASAGVSSFFYYGLEAQVRGIEPLLFKGPADAIAEVRELAAADLGDTADDPVPCPDWVWAADRSWVLNTDIDLVSTYIGCNEALAQAIIRDATLEALPVSPTTRVDDSADGVNTRA